MDDVSSGAGVELRQIFPQSSEVEAQALIRSLDLVPQAHVERPYVIANFVSSVDGRAAFHGRSGALGDDGDRSIFHALRERVDAILVGTGTLRAERYGPLVPDPVRRQRRAASGLAPEPLACVVTRSGRVPTDIPLFAEPASRIIIFTSGEADVSQCTAQVEVARLDPGELTLTTVLRRLRWDHDVRALLCEGGPTMFGALLMEQLVDELFLTLAPKLTGGGMSPTISSGPELMEPDLLEPLWALERAGSLYLRYALR